MIRSCRPKRREIVTDGLVAADDPPPDLVARPVTRLIGALTEVAPVPPAVAGLDAQPDGRPRQIDVDDLAAAQGERMLAHRLG